MATPGAGTGVGGAAMLHTRGAGSLDLAQGASEARTAHSATKKQTSKQTEKKSWWPQQVPEADARGYASEGGLLYFETSAKTNQNVSAVFEEIADK